MILTANVSDTIVVPCADCDGGTVTLGAKSVPTTGVPAGLSLVVPTGLSGTVPGVLQVGAITLNFTLVITPMVSPASISAVTAITGEKKSVFAQGELVTIWGSALSLGTAASNGASPLPTQLGCRVNVDGQASPLYYCSPGQINAVLPQKEGTGHHSLVVERIAQDGSAESRSAAFDITILATSPTLLGNSLIPVSLQNVTQDATGNTFVTASTPARPGDVLIIYATGLGLTNPPLSDGVAAVANVVAPISITVGGGESASLLGAVSSPQFPGLFQVAFVVPVDAVPDATGAIAAQLTVNDAAISFTIPIAK